MPSGGSAELPPDAGQGAGASVPIRRWSIPDKTEVRSSGEGWHGQGWGRVLTVLWPQLQDRGSYHCGSEGNGGLDYQDPGEVEESGIPRVRENPQTAVS